MKLRWSIDAQIDLREAIEFIAQDNPSAADEIADRVLSAVDRLLTYPNSGRIGRRDGTRELVVRHTPYLVIYRQTAAEVEIVRVWHTSREPHD